MDKQISSDTKCSYEHLILIRLKNNQWVWVTNSNTHCHLKNISLWWPVLLMGFWGYGV